jgi:hypothetical protein
MPVGPGLPGSARPSRRCPGRWGCRSGVGGVRHPHGALPDGEAARVVPDLTGSPGSPVFASIRVAVSSRALATHAAMSSGRPPTGTGLPATRLQARSAGGPVGPGGRVVAAVRDPGRPVRRSPGPSGIARRGCASCGPAMRRTASSPFAVSHTACTEPIHAGAVRVQSRPYIQSADRAVRPRPAATPFIVIVSLKPSVMERSRAGSCTLAWRPSVRTTSAPKAAGEEHARAGSVGSPARDGGPGRPWWASFLAGDGRRCKRARDRAG